MIPPSGEIVIDTQYTGVYCHVEQHLTARQSLRISISPQSGLYCIVSVAADALTSLADGGTGNSSSDFRQEGCDPFPSSLIDKTEKERISGGFPVRMMFRLEHHVGTSLLFFLSRSKYTVYFFPEPKTIHEDYIQSIRAPDHAASAFPFTFSSLTRDAFARLWGAL
jgi:hypothetical protein